MKSLRSRLTLSLSLLLIVAVALLAVGFERFSRGLVEQYVFSRLEHDADLLYARVHDAVDRERAAQDAAGTVYDLPLSGHYFRIVHDGQTIRSRSLWDADLAATPATAAQGVARQAGPAGQSLLVYRKRFHDDAQGWLIEVAEDVSAIDIAIAAFRRTLLIGLALAVVALVLVQRKLLVRGLAPLDDAVAACRRLERGETRVIDTVAPLEVQPMLDAVNRLVDHHGRRLARIRHATGNLSHALKTPLAVLGQAADAVAEQGNEPLAETLRSQLDAMRATIDRELHRRRLAGGGPSSSGFDARAELTGLAEALERLYRERGVAIDVDLPLRRFPFDREDMLELFGNLMDNACKWAGSRVRLVVQGGDADSDALRFRIDDDGPGVADELVGRLGAAGFRIDESRPGHGVGLAIVADIVGQYRGEIVYGRSELGGLRVEGRLPCR